MGLEQLRLNSALRVVRVGLMLAGSVAGVAGATAGCALVDPLDDVTADKDSGEGDGDRDGGAKPGLHDASDAMHGGKRDDAGAMKGDAAVDDPDRKDSGMHKPDAGTDAGPPLKCGDVTPGDAQLIRSCILQASCDPYVPAFSISRCIHLNAQSATVAGYCTRTATTCEDIARCIGRDAPLRENTNCGDADEGWRCDGDIATLCDPTTTQLVQVDCAHRGSTCEVYASGIVAVATAPCRAPVPTTCTEDANAQHCQANHVYTCVDGVPYGADCARGAALCDDESIAGTAFCDELPACEKTGATCDGNTMQQCDSSHSLALFDCGAVGNRCEQKGTQDAYCLPPGCTQADADACEESCDGSKLKLCGNIEVDCQDYGFSHCYEYTHPILGEVNVGCGL